MHYSPKSHKEWDMTECACVRVRARARAHTHTHTHTHISYLSLVIKDAKIEKTEIKSFVIFPEFV